METQQKPTMYIKQSDNKHLYYIMEVQRDQEGNVVDADKIVKVFHTHAKAKKYLGE